MCNTERAQFDEWATFALKVDLLCVFREREKGRIANEQIFKAYFYSCFFLVVSSALRLFHSSSACLDIILLFHLYVSCAWEAFPCLSQLSLGLPSLFACYVLFALSSSHVAHWTARLTYNAIRYKLTSCSFPFLLFPFVFSYTCFSFSMHTQFMPLTYIMMSVVYSMWWWWQKPKNNNLHPNTIVHATIEHIGNRVWSSRTQRSHRVPYTKL